MLFSYFDADWAVYSITNTLKCINWWRKLQILKLVFTLEFTCGVYSDQARNKIEI